MGAPRSRSDPSFRTRLIPRQREVLALIAQGATNGEIAERLGLSLEGAKWHIREIFARLGVDSREEAVEAWQHRRRFAPFGLAPLAFAGASAAAIAVVAAAGVGVLWATNSNESQPATLELMATSGPTQPTTTPQTQSPSFRITPVATRPQPPLVEVASGDGWRLLLADDGLGLPPAEERLLAVGYDQAVPYVNVLGLDGRIAARVETSYAPMARLNPVSGELLISDWAGAVAGSSWHARLLVFDLERRSLRAETALPQQRVNFTTPGSAVYVSANGRWFYWVEHGTVCPSGGDESVCDTHIVRAVDLVTMQPTPFAAAMPLSCGTPQVVLSGPSGLIAECLPRAGATLWSVDAAGPIQDAAVQMPRAGIPIPWPCCRAGNSSLEVSFQSDGALTGVKLLVTTTGERRAEWALSDAWSVYLLNDDVALLLRPSGRLERINLMTGIGEQLPYAIDPGRQGLDILFWR